MCICDGSSGVTRGGQHGQLPMGAELQGALAGPPE